MQKALRVAVVAPPFGDIGGPEVVVKNLVDALLEKGVAVTLFAPADWKTKAKHIPTLPKSLWNMRDFKKQTNSERRNLILISQLKVLQYQKDFDIIHIHLQKYAYLVAELATKPCVVTIHNRIDPREFTQLKKVAHTVLLSEGYKKTLQASAVIVNGIDTKKIAFSTTPDDYLITIGRLTEPKGIDTAIKIAQKVQKKLLIFGRIGNSTERQTYFNEKIKPHLNDQIIYMGETSQRELFRYLKKSSALIFPIRPRKNDYLTTFPLVAMESLACGTPIIGVPIQPLPKQLQDVTISCLSSDINTLIQAAKVTGRFDRAKCRELAEKYFDSSIMAAKYIMLYKKIISKGNFK